MADMGQIYDFAVKWREKFRDQSTNYIELTNHFMGDECAALGFNMDCAQAFSEKYGQAACDLEALEKIINEVTDISMLGSAIYSQWRYFNHWAYTGSEILEPQNRNWFITALSHLEKLSSSPVDTECMVVLFPEFAALKAEVEKLRAEISMLLLERDELRLVICKNIETAYVLAFGCLEYKAFELNCAILRTKRKIELIQAKKNRQEKVVLSVIEEILDKEFAEFQRQLDEQIDKMNNAIDRCQWHQLTDEETKEIKKLYRSVVKALHPDLHPEVTQMQIQLFQNAVQAYENGDLDSLRIISDMVANPGISEYNESSLVIIAKDKERLTKTLEVIREQIANIKSEYPYTMKELVNDTEQVAEKRAELEDKISELKEVYDLYAARLEEMLR